jgi:tRNA dimethylallyltransferase
MYGTIDLNKKFSTGQWLNTAIKKIKEIKKRKKIPILVGGTGLYFQSLVNGLVKIPEIPIKFRNKIRLMQKKEGQKKFYKKLLKIDPMAKDKFDQNDSQRTIRAFEVKSFTKISMYEWLNNTKSEFNKEEFLKLYIDFKREDLIKRISLRSTEMIEEGAIKEVKKFIKSKIKKDLSVNRVIGIDELTQYLTKKINLDQAQELISIKTRQYAKRQATWARSKMSSWKKINPIKIGDYIKKLKKSSLKLDQLT